MKQNFILWVAAVVITLLAGYLNSVMDPNYPISGRIGVNNEKIFYRFDKVYGGKEDFNILIKTESELINGFIKWRINGTDEWNILEMNLTERNLSASIPLQKPETKIIYQVFLVTETDTIQIPKNQNLETTFLGFVPSSIKYAGFITLFLGLLLSIRIALEYFNDKQKIKKLTLFAVSSFICYGIFISPVTKTFELGAVANIILSPSEMFKWNDFIFPLMWILFTILIFNLKQIKNVAAIAGVITLIIFLFFH